MLIACFEQCRIYYVRLLLYFYWNNFITRIFSKGISHGGYRVVTTDETIVGFLSYIGGYIFNGFIFGKYV